MIYCPPQGEADKIKFTELFHILNFRFIDGGYYNAKYIHWKSKLITLKGRALLKVLNNVNAEIISLRKVRNWPTDPNKIFDLFGFFFFLYWKAYLLITLKY